MTLNVLEAARLEAPEAAVVIAGSGEVYGPPERLPVDEAAALRPQNPYAVSKAACDLLGPACTRTRTACAWCACAPSTTQGRDSRTTTWSAR